MTIHKFLSRVKRVNECWEWQGYITKNGYGIGWHDNRNRLAHRISYELLVGSIPNELQIDHLCRNRKCVNPKHLEAVTQRENLLRGISPMAICYKRNSCLHGHLYTKENTRYYRNHRICLICRRAVNNEYNKKRAERLKKDSK